MFGIGLLGVLVIVLAITVILFVFICSRGHRDNIGATVVATILSLVVGISIYGMGSLIFKTEFINSPSNERVDEIVSVKNIKSLKPVESISGSFVLGSGSFSSEGYFYTLIEVGDGIYRKAKYPTSDTYLKETGKCVVTEYQTTYTNKRYTFWTGDKVVRHGEYWLIEVPKGTIIEEYQVM